MAHCGLIARAALVLFVVRCARPFLFAAITFLLVTFMVAMRAIRVTALRFAAVPMPARHVERLATMMVREVSLWSMVSWPVKTWRGKIWPVVGKRTWPPTGARSAVWSTPTVEVLARPARQTAREIVSSALIAPATEMGRARAMEAMCGKMVPMVTVARMGKMTMVVMPAVGIRGEAVMSRPVMLPAAMVANSAMPRPVRTVLTVAMDMATGLGPVCLRRLVRAGERHGYFIRASRQENGRANERVAGDRDFVIADEARFAAVVAGPMGAARVLTMHLAADLGRVWSWRVMDSGQLQGGFAPSDLEAKLRSVRAAFQRVGNLPPEGVSFGVAIVGERDQLTAAGIESPGGPVAAAKLGADDLALELLALQFLPLGLLLGRQQGFELGVGRCALLFELLTHRLAITIAAGAAQGSAVLPLNGADLFLLLIRQAQVGGDLRIGQGRGATLLKADLLESLELIRVQDFLERGIVGFHALAHFGHPLLAVEVTQLGEALALFLHLRRDFRDLLVAELQLLLNRFLTEQHEPAAIETAAAAAPLGPGRRRRQRRHGQHGDQKHLAHLQFSVKDGSALLGLLEAVGTSARGACLAHLAVQTALQGMEPPRSRTVSQNSRQRWIACRTCQQCHSAGQATARITTALAWPCGVTFRFKKLLPGSTSSRVTANGQRGSGVS